MPAITDLDHALLAFSEDPRDFWTVRDAVRGTQIFGGIGSGKSSGSGRILALSFLKSGFGGIILTGKVDETNQWIEYAKMTGRENDLIIFGAQNDLRFNPLEYEMTRGGEGAGETENIVNLFTAIIKMGNRINGGNTGNGDDPFWDMALQRCIKAAVDLIKLAREPLSIANITNVIRDAPRDGDYLPTYADLSNAEELLKDDPHNAELQKKVQELQDWISTSYCIKCIEKTNNRDLTNQEKLTFEVAATYFLTDLPCIADKTRSSITEYYYAFANPFRSGLLANYFAQNTSEEIKPEVTFNGKIIILDFPIKKYLQLGVYAQSIYKQMWQQAVERRDTNKYPIPIFLWIDEAQYFINENDMLFQTTARSSRACTVFISQNISNYYATIGGSHPKERVNSLLGNLATKIFHANNDYVTNEWAANTIGKTFQSKSTVSIGTNDNTSVSESLNYQIEPQEFTILRSGAEENDFLVEGIMTVAGRKWSDGRNYILTTFNQQETV